MGKMKNLDDFMDTKKVSAKCPTCGAKMVEYRHSLNIPLITALDILLRKAGINPINISKLNLTRNQWDNFQKLRYFGLVQKHIEDDKRVGGVWKITELGISFLSGKTEVHKSVWTYRGKFIRWEGSPIKVTDVIEGYEYRDEWAADAVIHEEG